VVRPFTPHTGNRKRAQNSKGIIKLSDRNLLNMTTWFESLADGRRKDEIIQILSTKNTLLPNVTTRNKTQLKNCMSSNLVVLVDPAGLDFQALQSLQQVPVDHQVQRIQFFPVIRQRQDDPGRHALQVDLQNST